MKLSVLQGNLNMALTVVRKAAPGKTTLPILSNILLRTIEGGQLQVQATNLELSLTYNVPAKVAENGEITIPAKTLCDLISTFKAGDVLELNLTELTQTLEVKCGRRKVNLKGIAAMEFPLIKLSGDELMRLSVGEFKRLMQAKKAVATDEARPLLTGVSFKTNGHLEVAASDGFTLMLITKKAILPIMKLIIPGRTLTEAENKLDDQQPVIISLNEGLLIISNGDFTLTSQMMEGDFPEYRDIIPQAQAFTATLDRAEMLSLLKTAEVISRDSAHTLRLKVNKDTEGYFVATFKASAAETGDGELTMDCPWTGGFEIDNDGTEKDHFEIAFNAELMKRTVEAVEGDKVVLGMNTPSSPIKVTSPSGGDYTGIVMPMHIGK